MVTPLTSINLDVYQPGSEYFRLAPILPEVMTSAVRRDSILDSHFEHHLGLLVAEAQFLNPFHVPHIASTAVNRVRLTTATRMNQTTMTPRL